MSQKCQKATSHPLRRGTVVLADARLGLGAHIEASSRPRADGTRAFVGPEHESSNEDQSNYRRWSRHPARTIRRVNIIYPAMCDDPGLVFAQHARSSASKPATKVFHSGCRSSATRSIGNSRGGFFLHW